MSLYKQIEKECKLYHGGMDLNEEDAMHYVPLLLKALKLACSHSTVLLEDFPHGYKRIAVDPEHWLEEAQKELGFQTAHQEALADGKLNEVCKRLSKEEPND